MTINYPWDDVPSGMTFYDVFRTNSYDPEAVTFIDIAQYIKSKMEITGEDLFVIDSPYIVS
jgi:hypothetical protein